MILRNIQSPSMKDDYLKVFRNIAEEAAKRMTFIATNRVNSCAYTFDRRICLPGDKIEVIKWHCKNGPTEIIVTSQELKGGRSCIPFNWVMEMGAPHDLEMYMPFFGKTWSEIIAEKEKDEALV